jgi:hypothetical protein
MWMPLSITSCRQLGMIMILVSLSSCNTSVPPPVPVQSNILVGDSDVTTITKELQSLPKWTDLSPSNDADRKKLVDGLQEISRYPTSTIREGILRYIAGCKTTEGGFEIPQQANLMLLNKYLFAIPDRMIDAGLPIDGWVVHESDDKVTTIWPFHAQTDGALILSGSADAHSGPPYPALQMFDKFREHYARRSKGKNLEAVGSSVHFETIDIRCPPKLELARPTTGPSTPFSPIGSES